MFLTDQFVEKVVVEHDVFTGAVTFDVLHEIRHGIAGAADRNIADRVHDFLEPLFCQARLRGSGGATISRTKYLKLFIRVGVRRATASNTDRVLAIGTFATPFW